MISINFVVSLIVIIIISNAINSFQVVTNVSNNSFFLNG